MSKIIIYAIPLLLYLVSQSGFARGFEPSIATIPPQVFAPPTDDPVVDEAPTLSPPFIDESSVSSQTLNGETETTLSMIVHGAEISEIKAWVVITPPNFHFPYIHEDLPNINLICEEQDTDKSYCSINYSQFMVSGDYWITYYVKTKASDLLATSHTSTITQTIDLSKIATPILIDSPPILASFGDNDEDHWFVIYYGEERGYQDNLRLDINYNAGITPPPMISIFHETGAERLRNYQLSDNDFDAHFSNNDNDQAHYGIPMSNPARTIIGKEGFYYIKITNPSRQSGTYQIYITRDAIVGGWFKGVLINKCTGNPISDATVFTYGDTDSFESHSTGVVELSVLSSSQCYAIGVKKEGYKYFRKIFYMPEKKSIDVKLFVTPILKCNKPVTPYLKSPLPELDCIEPVIYTPEGFTINVMEVGSDYNNKHFRLRLNNTNKPNEYVFSVNNVKELDVAPAKFNATYSSDNGYLVIHIMGIYNTYYEIILKGENITKGLFSLFSAERL